MKENTFLYRATVCLSYFNKTSLKKSTKVYNEIIIFSIVMGECVKNGLKIYTTTTQKQIENAKQATRSRRFGLEPIFSVYHNSILNIQKCVQILIIV